LRGKRGGCRRERQLHQRETPEQQTAVLCGACGHGIYCTLERKGERLGLLAFFDNEPSSSTYGEQIEHCPGCGKKLAIHNVVPISAHRGEPRKRRSSTHQQP
jgi:hypothetical protein